MEEKEESIEKLLESMGFSRGLLSPYVEKTVPWD
jgi:hypothetical protein